MRFNFHEIHFAIYYSLKKFFISMTKYKRLRELFSVCPNSSPMMTQLRHYLGTTYVGQASHNVKRDRWGWRHGSAAKSTCCFSRGRTFCSQHLCWAIVSQNPQSPVTPGPGTLTQQFIKKRHRHTYRQLFFQRQNTIIIFLRISYVYTMKYVLI